MSIHAVKSQQRAFWLSTALSLLFVLAVIIYTGAVAWVAGLISINAGIITFITLLSLIIGLYFYKLLTLRQGGIFIAQSLSAKRLSSAVTQTPTFTKHLKFNSKAQNSPSYGKEVFNATTIAAPHITLSTAEKLLLDVVAELSIAAGLTPPQVYVLDIRSGINAFVVGFSPRDLVLVVTRGLLIHLNRLEMEGVIAHELAHIRYADYRLNLRLLAMVSALGCIGDWGKYIIENSTHNNTYDAGWGAGTWLEVISPFHQQKKDYSLLIFLGIPLYVIGSLGSALCVILQSLVVKQREYLADATGTQFLRSDAVIAALLKVQAHTLKGSFAHPEAMRFSHFCFTDARLGRHWVSAHPNILRRAIKLKPALERQLFISSQLQQTLIAEAHETEKKQRLHQSYFKPMPQPSAQAAQPIVFEATDALAMQVTNITQQQFHPSHHDVNLEVNTQTTARKDQKNTPMYYWAQIEALFALHLDPKNNHLKVHEATFKHIQHLPENKRVDVFFNAVKQLQNNVFDKAIHQQRILNIIQSNHHVSTLEAVLFVWLQKYLFLEESNRTFTITALQQQLTSWFKLIIKEQNLTPEKMAVRFNHYIKRLSLLLPEPVTTSTANNTHPNYQLDLLVLLEHLNTLSMATRRQFLFMTEQLMFEDTEFSSAEQDALTIITVYLGIS